MNRLRLAGLTLLLCALGLSDLSAAPKKKKDANPAAPGTAPGSTPGGAAVDPKSFVIGPEDVLLVRVWNIPQVSGQVTVRPDGKITLQLLRNLHTPHLTPDAFTPPAYPGKLKSDAHA